MYLAFMLMLPLAFYIIKCLYQVELIFTCYLNTIIFSQIYWFIILISQALIMMLFFYEKPLTLSQKKGFAICYYGHSLFNNT